MLLLDRDILIRMVGELCNASNIRTTISIGWSITEPEVAALFLQPIIDEIFEALTIRGLALSRSCIKLFLEILLSLSKILAIVLIIVI